MLLIKAVALATLSVFVFLLDMMLKFALSGLLVVLLWLPFRWLWHADFNPKWQIAAIGTGAILNGLWEGCDLFLLRSFANRWIDSPRSKSAKTIESRGSREMRNQRGSSDGVT